MPEKLLSIKEVAELLRVSEDEVKRLVDVGEVPAYRIGGTFLRFRKEQIDAIRAEVTDFEVASQLPGESGPAQAPAAISAPDFGGATGKMARESPARAYEYTFTERIKDFFYFNDFYVLSFIVIGVLLYLIFRT